MLFKINNYEEVLFLMYGKKKVFLLIYFLL